MKGLDKGEIDARRRNLLVRSLALGVLAGGSGWNLPAFAALFGRTPYRMPENKSVFDLKGDVTADGKPVTATTLLTGNEKLVVGAGGHLVAVVGSDAFILREQSTLQMQATRAAKGFFRLVSGALLTVFGRRDENAYVTVNTPTATLGIRGTGVYVEADPEKSYVCICYGHTQIASIADPTQTLDAVSRHHDMPQYVLAKPDGGRIIVPAPMKNHTDLELMTLEALVGRTVPFGAAGTQYEAPRRDSDY
jgi:hypothetical protein